jgi:hypothetical protein
MAWAKAEEKAVEWDPSKWKEEQFWASLSPDSQDRWVSDFKPYYSLIGVYEISEGESLYRFILDDARKDELVPSSPKYWNVTIPHEKVKKDKPA